jgi:hypothetical protein
MAKIKFNNHDIKKVKVLHTKQNSDKQWSTKKQITERMQENCTD